MVPRLPRALPWAERWCPCGATRPPSPGTDAATHRQPRRGTGTSRKHIPRSAAKGRQTQSGTILSAIHALPSAAIGRHPRTDTTASRQYSPHSVAKGRPSLSPGQRPGSSAIPPSRRSNGPRSPPPRAWKNVLITPVPKTGPHPSPRNCASGCLCSHQWHPSTSWNTAHAAPGAPAVPCPPSCTRPSCSHRPPA